MKNIKIVYQYDGSCFYGNQRQLDKKTVSGKIEQILLDVFNEKVKLINSGRTDAKVHAKMQVSNFNISKNISLFAIKKAINKYAENRIKIIDISYVDEKYNSRYDIKERTYEYILINQENLNPFNKNYVSPIKFEIKLERLNEILTKFKGKHNFINFSTKDKIEKNPYKQIYEIYAIKEKEMTKIYIKANSFLKSMVRLIVGLSLHIYEKNEDINLIDKYLEKEDNNLKKYLAKPQGLYLFEVK